MTQEQFTIPLSRGMVALVDKDCVPRFCESVYFAKKARNGKFYAARHPIVVGGLGKREYMDRQVLGMQPGDQRRVEHLNGNTLDNRRANLRIVDPSPKGKDRAKE